MPDLIAQGAHRQHRWRRSLERGEMICLGRASGPWSVHWDDQISRQHVLVRWEGKVLYVESLPQAHNPVFFQGTTIQQCRLELGEHFVVGQTTFTVTDEEVSVARAVRAPVNELTFSQEYLRRIPFRDPGHRIEILSRLPERIAAATDEQELYEQLVRVLLDGIPNASAVALLEVQSDREVSTEHSAEEHTTARVADDDAPEITFLHWDSVDSHSKAIQPSQRLVVEAVSSRESVVHMWGEPDAPAEFTEIENVDWAFCTPLPGPTCDGWCLYVAGTAGGSESESPRAPADLRDEMKFAEVVATTFSSFCEVRALQRRQSALGQFFSPPVVSVLDRGDPDTTLAPREVDVTVFFSDLRGFSLETERSADDLLGLLQRVSDALGVLTRNILAEGGVIGDFHGDAAMGFWGWPIPQKDAAARAARAAIRIGKEFSHESQHQDRPLSNFRIGMGMASGKAVAGKIGTADQVKVTAFGPAVNLASRLESMSRQLHANILLDGSTAQQLKEYGNDDFGRLRRLIVARPYGLEASLEIFELLPPATDDSILTDEHIQSYEQALDAFVRGDWRLAWELLHSVPAADTSKDFLTTYIASRNRTAPDDWNGVVQLDSK